MIPKIIHYCWFGRNEKPELINEYIKTWKKNCPDYEIIEWNESNFDVNALEFTKQAYEAKKWAFVSDVARLYALYNCGGIYMDTDVEVLKPLDEFLENKAFTGFESKDSPITAVMGAEKNDSVVKMLLDYYNDIPFIKEDGSFNSKSNTHIITDYFLKKGIKTNGKEQMVDTFKIYPQIYFCPNNISRIFNIPSKKSYTIHHYGQSNGWSNSLITNRPFHERVRIYIIGVLRNIVGTNNLENLKKKIS